MNQESKLVETDALQKQLESYRQRGERIVFTNGCFDLLHVGHVRYLQQARALGQCLVVGLNSDASVRTIKGRKRPLVSQEQRAEVLAGLACVDYITIFSDPDPLNLIATLKPDILVKGDDWPEEAIIGAQAVKAAGGQVVRVPVVRGISTTGMIEKIIRTYG